MESLGLWMFSSLKPIFTTKDNHNNFQISKRNLRLLHLWVCTPYPSTLRHWVLLLPPFFFLPPPSVFSQSQNKQRARGKRLASQN